jgi:ubiquinone/menaquinone biosynthesis C-methylase UbiE
MVEGERQFGMGGGKVFPAERATSLLNPARRLVQSARRTIAAIGLRPDARVLELGCGPGYFSPSIAEATRGLYVLFDLQSEMLQIARTRVSASGPVGFVQGDGALLPFAPASFDAVFVATVLGEIPDQGRCIDDVRRVLRPEGVFAVAETRRDSDFIPLPALTTTVEGRDFRRIAKHGWRWQFVACFTPR